MKFKTRRLARATISAFSEPDDRYILMKDKIKDKILLHMTFSAWALNHRAKAKFFGLSKRQNEEYFTTQTPKNTSKRDSTVGPKALELVVSYGI